MSDQTDSSRQTDSQTSNWQPCSQGEVAGMVRRVQRRRRALAAARVTSLAAALLAVVAVWQFQPLRPAASLPGGISCQEVMHNHDAYQSGELDGREIADQIREHIAGCPHCAEKFPSESPQASQVLPIGRPVAHAGKDRATLIASGF